MTRRFQKTLLVLLTLVLVGFSWLGRFAPTTEAAVGLIDFRALPVASATEIKVRWETESERDMVGFRVKRSTTGNVQDATTPTNWPNGGNWPNTGSASSGGRYEFTDSGLTTGTTYTYWLYELTTGGAENLLNSGIPASATAGAPTPTSIPTPTPTSVPTQQLPTTTPTEIGAAKTPTHTPTVPRVVGPSATPTKSPPGATATFTVPPQATNTPIGDTPTQQPTNTSVPVTQGQPTNTPVVSVPTPIVEGATPDPSLPIPEVKAGATVGAVPEESVTQADQTLQVPPTPTQVLDAAAASGMTSDVTPTSKTTNATPQAVAQEAASGSAPSTERLARPTATPRPSATAESSSGAGSLLLILGGASLCGAVVLALAALVIWRRR